MTAATTRVDAVVVGAGTAGANAALQLARRGLDVAVLERRPAARAGAQWHNGILDRQLRAAGIEPSRPPEGAAAGGTTHLCTPDGRRAVTVHGSPIVRADMARLGDRLRSLAVAAGVELVDRADDLDVEVVADRPRAATVTVDGRRRRFEAALLVDASGRTGVVRRHSPVLVPWCPPVGGAELCTASDHHVEVADRSGAEAFLERWGARPGEGVTVVGLAGGWSTRAITISADLSHAAVLVGCVATGGYGTGPSMLAETRAAEPWLGRDLACGSGVIPLRRPYSRLTAPGVALVGDAACQVFPAHGSGIGLGLIAGTMLAEAVDGAADPGDERVLWRYQAQFWHEHGGTLAALDAFRRMSTRLGERGVARMAGAGLLTEDMTLAGLDQRWQVPAPRTLPATAARLARVPDVAATMLPMLLRGQLLRRLGPQHPDAPDLDALARWDRRVERLLGPVPR